MAPNQPPNRPSPLDGAEDHGQSAPPAHGSSAAPPPYGRPPGEYTDRTDAGADPAAPGLSSSPVTPRTPIRSPVIPRADTLSPATAGRILPARATSRAHSRITSRGRRPASYQQGYPQGYPPGYPAPYGWVEPKSRLAAGLLGIFLGGLGIHRFYLGYTTLGIVQLLVTLFTFGAGAIWGFVEGIMILAGAQSFRVDARGVPLRE